MRLNKLSALLLSSALLMSSVCYAKEIKAVSTYGYSGGVFSSDPSSSDREKALQKAKIAAVREYVSTFDVAKRDLYKSVEKDVEANIDEYITSYNIVDEQQNDKTKTLTYVIRANVDTSKIDVLLKGNTMAGVSASGDGSVFSFMFVGREVSDSTMFMDRVTNISSTEASRSSSMSSGEGSSSRNAQATSKQTTGGNVKRKNNQDVFRLISTNDFDSSFNQVLSQYGYETVDYMDVQSECGGAKVDKIKQDFVKNDEMSADIRKKMLDGARKCEVRYMAVGYMNVSLPMIDSVTGNQMVIVSINGQVWNLDKKLPRKIASVGPVQFKGLGPDKDSAKRNALQLAAKEAASSISSQLGNKNVY